MPIVKPMTFSDEEVSNMVAAVKTLRPDLWERFVAHERADEGYEEISREILQIIHDAHPEMLANQTCKRLRFKKRPLSELN